MPLTQPATTQPGIYHEAFLQYTPTAGTKMTVVFDSVLSEDWENPTQVTEHPVEQGADVADHVRVGLAKCTLKVRMSNEPIGPNQFVDPIGDKVPLPLGVPTPKQSEFSGIVVVPTWENNLAASVSIGTVAGIVSDIVGTAVDAETDGTPLGNKVAAELTKQARVTNDIDALWVYPETVPELEVTIGGFPVRTLGDVASSAAFEGITALIPPGEEIDVPTATDAGLPGGLGFSQGIVAQTLQFSNLEARDFAAEMMELLVTLKDDAQLFTVQGSKQVQGSMVIETLTSHRGAPDETGTGMDITIGLRQVRFVSTNTVTAPLPKVPSATPPVNKGAQDPTPADPAAMQSVGHKFLSGGVNLLSGGSPPGVPVR